MLICVEDNGDEREFEEGGCGGEDDDEYDKEDDEEDDDSIDNMDDEDGEEDGEDGEDDDYIVDDGEEDIDGWVRCQLAQSPYSLAGGNIYLLINITISIVASRGFCSKTSLSF